MTEKASNKCKIGDGGRTWSGMIAESVDAGERQSTILNMTSNIEKGSISSANSEPEIIPPDGGWGWVIVLASFFIQLIGGY